MMAMLDFQHRTELGAQMVALEQKDCWAVVSGQSKSLPAGQGWHLCEPHCKSIPSPVLNGAVSLLALPDVCNMH